MASVDKAIESGIVDEIQHVVEFAAPFRCGVGLLQRNDIGVNLVQQCGDPIEILVGALGADEHLIQRRIASVTDIQRRHGYCGRLNYRARTHVGTLAGLFLRSDSAKRDYQADRGKCDSGGNFEYL
jgi:hypothetical protein